MKKHLRLFALAATCFYLACSQAAAQDEAVPDDLAGEEKIRVRVEVVGDENWEVKSYLEQVLKRIEDVEVVEDLPGVYVHVITRRLVSNRGRRLGYVIAATSSQIWDVFLEGGHPFHCSDYFGMWMEVGPDLRELAVKCVIAINTGVLNNIRQMEGRDAEVVVPFDASAGAGD